MDKQEFLLLIPGIIYGVAIVDLLKIVQHKVNYWEVVFWGLMLLITIINHWMNLYQKLEYIVDDNVNFFLIIGQAMVYAQAANVITPDSNDEDTKAYFFEIRRKFFLIIAASILVNILLQFVVLDDHQLILRLTNLPVILACAFINKIWLRIVVGIYVVGLSIVVIFIQ